MRDTSGGQQSAMDEIFDPLKGPAEGLGQGECEGRAEPSVDQRRSMYEYIDWLAYEKYTLHVLTRYTNYI